MEPTDRHRWRTTQAKHKTTNQRWRNYLLYDKTKSKAQKLNTNTKEH